MDGSTLARRASQRGVMISVLGPRMARLVTHLDVDDEGIEYAARVLIEVLTESPGPGAQPPAKSPG